MYDRHKRPCGTKMLDIPATDITPLSPPRLIEVSIRVLRVRVAGLSLIRSCRPPQSDRPAKKAGNLRCKNTPRLDEACLVRLRHFSDADG